MLEPTAAGDMASQPADAVARMVALEQRPTHLPDERLQLLEARHRLRTTQAMVSTLSMKACLMIVRHAIPCIPDGSGKHSHHTYQTTCTAQ